MRTSFYLFLILHWFACKSPEIGLVKETKITDTITNQAIAEVVDTLSSDYMEGRGFGTTGIDRAAVYIENFLKSNKIKPYFVQYRDSFIVGNRIGYNIVGLIEGTDETLKNEYIILSAHYDHIGKVTGKKDSVYNGANDNATGTSAVLNIAKSLQLKKTNKRSIIIALFSGEEIGLTGAEHFAGRIIGQKNQVYCNLNIDMIGSVLTDQPKKVYISGYNKSNMASVLNQFIGNESIIKSDQVEQYGIFGLSDNYPIYQKLNIPAHTFCTYDFQNYKHYHRFTDEIQNVDIENTGAIVRFLEKAFSGLATSELKNIVLSSE